MAVLRTEARLDSTQYHAGIRSMQGANGAFEKSLSGIRSKLVAVFDISGLVTQAASFLAKETFGKAVQARQVGSAISDMAEQAGLTTDEFQAMASAFREAGLEEEKLIQLAIRLRDAQGTAAQEAGGAKSKQTKSLESLGITPGMTTAQAIDRMGAALNDSAATNETLAAIADIGGRFAPRTVAALKAINSEMLELLILRKQQAGVIIPSSELVKLDRQFDAWQEFERMRVVAAANLTTLAGDSEAETQRQAEAINKMADATRAAVAAREAEAQAAAAVTAEAEKQAAIAKEQAAHVEGRLSAGAGAVQYSSAARMGGMSSAGFDMQAIARQLGVLQQQLSALRAIETNTRNAGGIAP